MFRFAPLACLGVLVGLAPAQPPLLAPLQREHLPPAAVRTWALAAGDVDGDGDVDLVAGVRYGADRLWLNDGRGVFREAPAGSLPAPGDGAATALLLLDLDGDGDLDLAAGHDLGRQNRLYVNDGRGRFADATAPALPARADSTRALAAGDVDGDGDPDLVVGNGAGEPDRLLLNDGRGVFRDAPAGRFPAAGARTTALGLADLDGDGDLDLVVGGDREALRLYRNAGGGSFADAGPLPGGSPAVTALGLADLDRDGDLDLVAGTLYQNLAFLNDGTGRFADATAALLPAGQEETWSLGLADLDGDGDADLAVGNLDQRNQLLLNDGTGRLRPASLPPVFPRGTTRALLCRDLDGDGDPDLLWGNDGTEGERGRLLLNDGAARFADATAEVGLPSSGEALAWGDLDGDGDLDLAVGAEGPPCLLENLGGCRFAPLPPLPGGGGGVLALALGDVDMDGDLDLLAGFQGEPDRLWLNDGRGGFAPSPAGSLPAVPATTRALVLGDVDGDGDPDAIVGLFGRQNLLLRNDGTGRFRDDTAGNLPAVVDMTTALALGDLDGDGDPDLVVGNQRLGPGEVNRVYRNDGRGRFADATAAALPAGFAWDSTLCLGLADVDGDGDPDLYVGNAPVTYPYPQGGQDQLYLNDGRGRFTDATASRLPAGSGFTRAVSLGDVDGDGDLDLAAARTPTYAAGGVELELGLGGGFFAPAPGLLAAGRSRAGGVGLADLDEDGDLDAIVGNGWGEQDGVLWNRTRQVFAPWLPRPGRGYRVELHAWSDGRQGRLALPFLAPARGRSAVPPCGVLGLAVAQMVALSPCLVSPQTGWAGLDLVLPADPALAGGGFHVQALVLADLGWPPLTSRLSNVWSEEVGRW